jgi:hypothetical protein
MVTSFSSDGTIPRDYGHGRRPYPAETATLSHDQLLQSAAHTTLPRTTRTTGGGGKGQQSEAAIGMHTV